jgi:CRISPR/Cas system CSM-associated protein Csm3 (group 7 of RAMP superfamily)
MTAPVQPSPSMHSPRTYVRVDLALDSQWRIGTWGNTVASDDGQHEDRLVVATLRDPQNPDAPYVPGSSVRGALRAHLRQALGPERTQEVFGPDAPEQEEDAQAEPAELSASPWWVLGARVAPGSWSQIRTRGQTGIDRIRRAPEQGSFRSAQTVVPVGEGPHLHIYLRCDAAPDSPVAADVLSALSSWQPRIGAGRTVGMGRAHVVAIQHRGAGTDRDSLLARLAASGGPSGIDTLLTDGTPVELAPHDPSLAWPLLLSARFRITDGWEASQTRDVVDGTTWKGMIRSRVEFIGRSPPSPRQRIHSSKNAPETRSTDSPAASTVNCSARPSNGASRSRSRSPGRPTYPTGSPTPWPTPSEISPRGSSASAGDPASDSAPSRPSTSGPQEHGEPCSPRRPQP